MATAPTYDGTAPAAHEVVAGPGNPRLAHAYPTDSNIALCGTTGHNQPTRGNTPKCALCVHLGRPGWISR